MYIEPNTTIKLYSGIPLDNTYKNTLFFANVSAQNSYFHSGIQKYTFARQSYQRVERGRMRIEVLADNIYDCNYLAFQNENFGNKWFYAFINSIDYVNNTTSEITFEIDVMQTWYFDYELLDSFVEREHTNNDTIGANLVDEGLELGDYVIGDSDSLGLSEYNIVVMTSEYFTDPASSYPNINWKKAGVTLVGGTLQACHYWTYETDATGRQQLEACLEVYSLAGKTDEILGVFLLPKMFSGSVGSVAPFIKPKQVNKSYDTFDGYTPKNNKLYTYPYNFLYVTNMQGNSAIYPYEYFTGSSGKCDFNIYGIWTANCELTLFPLHYKGLGVNKDESLTLKGFPQCAYTVDAYRAWLAQNAAQVSTGIGLGAGAIYGGALALGLGTSGMFGPAGLLIGATSVVNSLAKIYDKSVQPNQTKGVDTNTNLSGARLLDFVFMNKHIRGEFARIIDNFFTMYGYKTNRVKTPNIHVRQRWTYTKTIGCNLKGEAPVDALKKIISIYDNGITFWVNASEVGNYALSNPTI